jgi:RNA recognition motif-containing protein
MATTETITKKEKTKKSKKVKAEKTEEAEHNAPLNETAAAQETEDAGSSTEKSRKKRKRETGAEDELEIDVSLPEPLSKKAARKAKKSKTTTSTDAVTGETTAQDGEQKLRQENEQEKAERRTSWGIWIGNLPWTASKQDLRDFICATATIKPAEITRVHMPAPRPTTLRPGEAKQTNKGFAYVDFDSPEGLEEALKLSETAMDSTHRKVLIKNANSFAGRPDPKPAGEADARKSETKVNNQKPLSKRIFVGNLSFDTTKEDLEVHFGQCGGVLDVHVATFEDSGKCKGFAWVTFENEEASTSAVNGFIYKKPADLESDEEDDPSEGEADAEDSSSKPKKKSKKVKPHKWYVNKLQGRMLRCEFAEDASTRYKKRFGKDAPSRKEGEVNGAGGEAGLGEVDGLDASQTSASARPSLTPHDKRREARRAQSIFSKVDARTIKPGAALAHAQRDSHRATGAIVEGTGSKISFD